MTKRLILIDGSSMLSSNFFGSVPSEWYGKNEEAKEIARQKMMKTSDGRYTNGVFAMTKMLLKLMKEHSPTHIAIAWDISRNTFRREMYAEYKAHRGETAQELRSQFPLMQEVIDAMGLPQFSVEGFEADDIIGTLAKRFEAEIPVVVMTKDQDALQLISEKTRVWLNTSTAKKKVEEFHGVLPKGTYKVPDNFFEFTPDTFEYFYGLTPTQIIDSKALEGDNSDNIPGVKGVGPKAVLPLLQEFKTVEGIYEYLEDNSENVAKDFLKELGISRPPLKPLLEGKDMAYLSKELATIKTDMVQFKDTKIEELHLNVDKKTMENKFRELEFNSLLDN